MLQLISKFLGKTSKGERKKRKKEMEKAAAERRARAKANVLTKPIL